jgi:hypothetical protein
MDTSIATLPVDTTEHRQYALDSVSDDQCRLPGPPEFCGTWPNQETVSIKGFHFLQEEAPDEFGEALARFVAKVRAGASG